jgi:hypothetical protein
VIGEAATEAVGIHVDAVLPTIAIDHDRWFETDEQGLDYQDGPLDRPSVYLGGTASGVEVDAGLSWDRVYDPSGRPTWTDRLGAGSDGQSNDHRFSVGDDDVVRDGNGKERARGLRGLVENFAFRPFWRAEGSWHNPAVGSDANVYFYGAETIRMQLKASGPAKLELVINSDDVPARSFSIDWSVSGWGVGAPQAWKRVSSIDQFTVQNGKRVGLETAGLDVLPTRTRAYAMRWAEVKVISAAGATLFHLDCDRKAVIGADALWLTSYGDVFRLVDQNPSGAESIWIVPPEP